MGLRAYDKYSGMSTDVHAWKRENMRGYCYRRFWLPIWLMSTIVGAGAFAGREVAAQASIQTYFTQPVCGPYPYSIPLLTVSGDVLREKPRDTYCLPRDALSNKKNELRKRFFSALDGSRQITDVWIYVFAFNDVELADQLCTLATRNASRITLVSASGERDLEDNDAIFPAVEHVLKCRNKLPPDKQHLIRAAQVVGGVGGMVSFHPKLYMVRYADGTGTLITSSGHPGKGMSVNFEHWQFLELGEKDGTWQLHRCFGRALELIGFDKVGLRDTRTILAQCGRTGQDAKLRAFFLPFERQRALAALSDLIGKSRTIDIAVFSAGNESIVYALKKAIEHGAAVRLLLDDDVYWHTRYACATCKARRGEFESWVYPLLERGAQVRLLETNHHCAVNLMHHKFVVFSGADGRKTVLFGSANFSESAYGALDVDDLRGNVEQVYTSQEQSVSASFSKEFERLWGLATVLGQMPKATDPAAPTHTGCQ